MMLMSVPVHALSFVFSFLPIPHTVLQCLICINGLVVKYYYFSVFADYNEIICLQYWGVLTCEYFH